jgi:hypothetical protein
VRPFDLIKVNLIASLAPSIYTSEATTLSVSQHFPHDTIKEKEIRPANGIQPKLTKGSAVVHLMMTWGVTPFHLKKRGRNKYKKRRVGEYFISEQEQQQHSCS